MSQGILIVGMMGISMLGCFALVAGIFFMNYLGYLDFGNLFGSSDDTIVDVSTEESADTDSKSSGGDAAAKKPPVDKKIYISLTKCAEKDSTGAYKLLSVNGAKNGVETRCDKASGNLSVWRLQPVDKYYYKIRNESQKKYIAADKEILKLKSSAGDSASHWIVKSQKDDSSSFCIQNRKTRKYLHISGEKCTSGSVLSLADEKYDKTQVSGGSRWKLSSSDGGWSKLFGDGEKCGGGSGGASSSTPAEKPEDDRCAILYDHFSNQSKDYYKLCIDPGQTKKSISDLKTIGFNDKIQGVKVPNGATLTLWEHPGWGGKHLVLTGGTTHNLSERTFEGGGQSHDRASAAEIKYA
jgi:hypothetical protein